MVKTVFGIPGIGEKARETAGDAVAPGGTPGAQRREKLPQKSGEDVSSPSRDTQATPDKTEPARPPVAHKPEAPAKPEMAKPVAPPLAKPAPPSMPPIPGAAGGKTVFGMPAMKLPEEQSGRAATEPAKAPWEDQQDSAEPDGNVKPKEGDAYKATVLGMAAIDIPGGVDASAEEEAPPEIEKMVGVPEVSGAKPIRPPEARAPSVGLLTSSVRGSARFPDNISSSRSSSAVVIAIIVLCVALIAIIYFLFSSSDEPDVSDTAPAAPARSVPVVPTIPTAPSTGSAQ
jgi:hypothetical protein